jgi:hypothetical protein
MDVDLRILCRIARNPDGANWYTLRYVEVDPYPSANAALRALAAKGWLEEVAGDPYGRFRLTQSGRELLASYGEAERWVVQKATAAVS